MNEFGEIYGMSQRNQLCAYHSRHQDDKSSDSHSANISLSPNCYKCMNLRSRRTRPRNVGEEEEDEMGRYKENFAKITRIKTDIYSNKRIEVEMQYENL